MVIGKVMKDKCVVCKEDSVYDLDENIIWVGTDDGNVQVTQDGGKTWENTVSNITGLPANTWCYHIELSPLDTQTSMFSNPNKGLEQNSRTEIALKNMLGKG